MTIEKAIKLLKTEYGKAKQLEFVHDATAYALYKTWKEADRDCKKREKR